VGSSRTARRRGFPVGARITGTELTVPSAEEVVVPNAGLSRITGGVDDRTRRCVRRGVSGRLSHAAVEAFALQAGDEVNRASRRRRRGRAVQLGGS